ncbi:auxin efflux carrier [Exidia glandulosa HHB12029]|uniref:Auxin efflux carrier n=1 Tax=Exidia glandulosa HHB12029 TaxID=1314781 RepID=A0A165PUF2_EXIGL|nr:auxin efflux carrier [Exidia glandulosa HHB12029]
MPTVGALVWMSCRPLIKMALSTSCGFILTRMGMFGPMHARGCGQVVIKVFYPALLFAKIVTGISTDNISAIAPLVVVSSIYLILGGLMSLVATQFFWVPHRFRYGIHAAGIFGNFGDIPTALIVSVTAIPPFAGQKDSDTAVAYISIFTLGFFLCLFPFGGHALISNDFAGPDRDISEVRKTVREQLRYSGQKWNRALAGLLAAVRGNLRSAARRSNAALEVVRRRKTVVETELEGMGADEEAGPSQLPKAAKGEVTAKVKDDVEDQPRAQDKSEDVDADVTADEVLRPPSPGETIAFRERVAKITAAVQALVAPITVAMLIGLIVAVIRPLKSLFVALPNSPTPHAPDGQPALAFIMDTTTFLGGGAVPLGLVCLGSALASIKVPRNEWNVLPFGAISALVVGKLLIMPVLGFLLVDAFVRIGFIPENDKVLRFVCLFMSCVPTSTTQVFLTQMYSPDGRADHVSAFLLPQYAVMFASMSFVTAYTLHVLF